MAGATLLLPDRARFAGLALPPALAKALGRADRSTVAGAQRERVLDILPRGWPAAAATRQLDAGDAAHSAWLRADPAYVRPDINGARLLGWGGALSLTEADSTALLRPLRPLFGDAGFPIDAPHPARWYLRLPLGAKLPAFATPEDALGADLFEHLPGSADTSAEARRWRALLSEAQVVLHNHPRNAERIEAGLPPVNSLWFWGAGVLPDRVRSPFQAIATRDDALHALAALGGVQADALPQRWPSAVDVESAFDLRDARDPAALIAHWIAPAAEDMAAARFASLTLDFADGASYRALRGQRWRFWRRPLQTLAAGVPT